MSIPSSIARAKAFLTGNDVVANKTTIETKPTKAGGNKTTIKTTGAQSTGNGAPPVPPKPAHLAAAGGSIAPRAALPGMAAAGVSVPSMIANTGEVNASSAEVNSSVQASSDMFAQIQQSAMATMHFQRQNAQLQSLTKMSEATAKQIKNIGEGIKSTGAQ